MYLSKRKLICFILLMPIFQPIYLDYITTNFHFYTLLQYASLAYILIGLVQRRTRLSNVSLLAIIMQLWILLATIIGNGYFNEAFRLCRCIAYTFLVFDFYKDQFELLLKQLLLHSEICIYANLFTLLIAPNGFLSRNNSAYGMTQEWFLGADAYFIMWILPALVIAWIYAFRFKRNKRAIIISLASIVTEIIRGSGTGMVAVSVFFIVMLLPFVKKFLTPLRCACIGAIIFVSIILFRRTDFVSPILDLLGKDMTFTGRLTIWDNAISCILNKPIFGYGVLTNDTMVNFLGRSSTGIWAGATHCHCQFLQIAFQGGFIALLLLISIIGIDIYKCTKIWPNRMAQMAGVSIAIYIIMSITEVFSFPIMYMIFPLINLACDWEEGRSLKLKGEMK